MNWTYALIAIAAVAVLFGLKRLTFVSAQTAREHLRNGALVVDVRGPGEYTAGHLPNAVNVPLGELQYNIARVAPDKNQVLLLHCLSGTRSGIAKGLLKKLGYARVFNLGSYGRARSILSSQTTPDSAR